MTRLLLIARFHTALIAAAAALGFAAPVAGQVTATFEVAGEKYPIKRYPEQTGAAKRPVAVLIHGVDGMAGQSGSQIEKFAEQIAGDGFLVVVPHYFGKDDGADTLPLPELLQRRVAKVQTYLPRIAAAVEYSLKQDDADVGRLGLVGFSLGGGLVLEYAESAPSGKVKAVVDYFGFIADQAIFQNAGKLPPTLVLHNTKDKIVSLKFSEDLLKALKMNGVKHDHQFYGDGDPERGFHPFLPGGADDINARARTINWLKIHLKPSN